MTLTEKYLKDNLITAYFVDNERKNIEVLTTSEDKKITLSTIIPFDENFVSFKALTKFINIDQLHELTHKKNNGFFRIFFCKDSFLNMRIGHFLNVQFWFCKKSL